jgi:LuxR family glucitol operon transcriptional activator
MTEFLSNLVGQMLGEVLGESLDAIFDRRALERALAVAVTQAEQRFAREYRLQDADLVDALTTQTRFADLPSVRAALRELLTRPFHDTAAPIEQLRRSFDDVLPERLDRARVDAAIAAFLNYLGREVLYIPQLRDVYGLAFQKMAADSSHRIAASADAMAQHLELLRAELVQAKHALPGLTPPAALPPPARLRPWHNLPQRSYTRFVGRQAELEQLRRLLLPHPRSRHFVITLDGIGGVGKSALALELAYGYRDGYVDLPADERFEAIVWASAKRTLLTAGGIQQRQQTFNTLNDLYREIAMVFDQLAILQADAEQRRGLVERVLASQRTLLIVDNLETVDDEELLAFLREIPNPTKVIITTRHRIDIAYTIRLAGMPEADAQALMLVEAARKNVDLTVAPEPALPFDPLRNRAVEGSRGRAGKLRNRNRAVEGISESKENSSSENSVASAAVLDDLYRKTGGIPLAIVWSIGLMSLGHSIESVLRRLGSGHSDIARFCFTESVAHIRDRDAYRLLLALALFESHVSRAMLGDVAGMGDDVIGRDDGLAELLQLSLVEQKGERFFLLPLTQSYVLAELAARPELERELREGWIDTLAALGKLYASPRWQHPNRVLLKREGIHLVTLANWAQQAPRPDVLLTLLPALFDYYDLTGQWDAMLKLGQTGLEYAQLTGDLEGMRGSLSMIAWLVSQQGRHDEAEWANEEALAIALRIDDVAWQCDILVNASQILRRQGRFDEAMARCQAAIRLLPMLSNAQRQYVEADINIELGKIARDQQDWQTAQKHFQAAQAVFRLDIEDPVFNIERAWGAIGQFAFVSHQLGDLENAAKMYQESIDFLREMGSRGFLTTLQVRFATLEEQRGNRAVALEYAREALEWSRKLGMAQERAQAEALVARLNAE